MIAQCATRLQLPLLAVVEEGPQPTANALAMPGQVGNGLRSDPLIDETRQARRRAMARTLCQFAATPAAWEMANRLALDWGFSCQALGVEKLADPEEGRRRRT